VSATGGQEAGWGEPRSKTVTWLVATATSNCLIMPAPG
jgi:hypothetical protein